MVYARGNRKIYDDWAAEGCSSWSYDKVLPFFIKLENTSALSPSDIDPGYHGKCGPMSIEKPHNDSEFKALVLKALIDMGMKVRDTNGKRQTGIYDTQCTFRNSRRCSTAKAYLVPVEDRPNLTIVKLAFVTKILIKHKRAYGVEFDFEKKGNTERVYARKEVIISAGSVRTPQLLMLSGIGPKEQLEKHNIKCVVDRPAVGKNLHDHPTVYTPYLVDPTIPHVLVKNLNPLNIIKYFTRREGCLTSPNQIVYIAFINGQNTTSTSKDCPRQQIYFNEYATIYPELNYNLKPEVFEKYYGKYKLSPMYACAVCLIQPESRGEILLNSTDPYEHPLINPNYFHSKRDVEDLVEGMKFCEAVSKSPGIKKLGVKHLDTPFPGCENYAKNQNKYLKCRGTSEVTSLWHPVGTARMGLPDDPRSVVDCQLKVIGVKNLRVVNAAVMPIIPSGNTNIPTMMVAERVYDMMKNDICCTSK